MVLNHLHSRGQRAALSCSFDYDAAAEPFVALQVTGQVLVSVLAPDGKIMRVPKAIR